MAWYWDYSDASTASSTTATYWQQYGTGPTWSNTSSSVTSASTGSYWVYVTQVRHYLIECPSHWDDAVLASFVRLVNDETVTGFTVEMVIDGEVRITDPSIERRSMVDFVPLLRQRAAPRDRVKIEAFFNEFGVAPPEPPA